MLGFIKKDIYMIMNNLKLLVITIVLFIGFGSTNDMNIGYVIPFMIVMMSISTFSYDEYNNWNAYALAMPNGRVYGIKSKYISTIVLTVIATVLGILLSIIMGIVKNTLNIEEIFSSICSSVCVMFGLVSFLYPIMFKYGVEKSRLAVFIVAFGLFGIVTLVSKYISTEISLDLALFLKDYGNILLVVASVVMLIISYLVSKRIYLKREY